MSVFFFFFKQKTAYEMRISDWSSDVCSSDLLGKTPRTRAVTAFRFREMRLSCALSVAAAAKVLHVTERTVHNWESGASRVPYAAYKLLRLLRGGELPGAAWKGWRLHGDTMYSPEGHGFGDRDHAWWSLLVRRERKSVV